MDDDLVRWLLLGSAVLAILWVLAALWTLHVARRHGGSCARWFLYGTLLGPIGVLLSYRMVRACPTCGAVVLRDVLTCPSCENQVPRMDPNDHPEDYMKTYRKTW